MPPKDMLAYNEIVMGHIIQEASIFGVTCANGA